MTPSEIKAISDLVIGPAGALVLAVIVIVALARVALWLLAQVLQGKDMEIAYREQQLIKLQKQLDRQQDLFDQALELLEAPAPRHRGGSPRG